MKVAVVGAGYVGLVTGACLADGGHSVTCADVDEGKVAALRDGELPFHEPGLEELVRRNAREGRLRFTASTGEAARGADVAFVAVGTPLRENGDVDVSGVFAAAEAVGREIREYAVVAVKSTVPVGTCEELADRLAPLAGGPFDVASNPEFLKEGSAIDDFLEPDRIVVGTGSERARRVLAELYAPYARPDAPVLFMDARSAELTKYAANAMLAARVSFMNDVAALCDRLGADVDEVRKGMGADRRIGHPFLFPGIGFGGSFFPGTVQSLLKMARASGLDFDLLRAVQRVNERQKRVLVEKALRHFGSLQGRTLAVWGLAYKPRTDDLREAPSIAVVEGLVGNGARVRAYDPVAGRAAARAFGGRIEVVDDAYAAAEGADALFLVTEWAEFRQPDFERLRRTLRQPVLFDGRNAWDRRRVEALGFAYHGVGRGGPQNTSLRP